MLLENEIYIKSFKVALEDTNILEPILTMGLPPIAKFDSILISEATEINLKSLSGVIVSRDRPYDEDIEYLLLNVRVKDGNSGGPIINKFGSVCGVICNMPMSLKGSGFDELGYGLALAPKYIFDFLSHIDQQQKVTVTNTDNIGHIPNFL